MPIQSLGIFDSVFDWVCDKIFDPIIDWLSKILNSIFQWILDNIVIPLLMPVFEFLWNIVIANIADIFFTFIYKCFVQFLWLLDQLQNGFDIMIGMKDVTYYSESAGTETQTTLLQYFMNNDIVRNALLSITFLALGLSIIFSIYAVMRSTLDFDFEGKRPVGKVLNSVAKMMISFLLVPTIAVVGVSLISIVLKQTCIAINGGSDASLGKWVLAISSMDAGRGNPPTEFMNAKTGEMNEPWASLLYDGMDYITFGTQIHVSHVDYLIGYASIIFMTIVMIACLFTFIKRIFDVIILYITSPYFISTIVLDDGEKFRKWRESFIARILIGFGSVIGLRIFLMMVPVIMDDKVKIFDSFVGNIAGGYVIRLVFILGGMFAVYKSSTLLTGIISANVAAEENMNNTLLGGLVAGGMMKGAKSLAGAGVSAFSKMRSKSKTTSSSSSGSSSAKSSKFTGGSGVSAAKGKYPQSNKPRQKNYLSDKEYDDTLSSVDELFRTGTLGTDYQAEKDYEDTLSSVDELFRTGTLGTDYQAEKDYEDTLSSVDELFKTGTLGSAYQDEENAYEGVRNLFGEDNGEGSFNDGSKIDFDAQDIVKNVDPLEAAKNTSSSSSAGSSGGSSGSSAQFTGDAYSSSGTSSAGSSSSYSSSSSNKSADTNKNSNLDDPLLKNRSNNHKNDSGKF